MALPRVIRRLSLRARLTMLSVLLVAVGLVAAGIATRQELQGFLVHRVDEQLAVAQKSALGAFLGDDPEVTQFEVAAPEHSFIAVVGRHGAVRAKGYGTPLGSPRSLAAGTPNGYSTAGGYRMLSRPGPQGTRLVVGVPLSDVNSTLNRLTGLELLVGGIVLIVAGALAYALVRVELRPLRKIEDTAAAIAAGDLSRRVEEGEPTTEVGSLGASLNSMLSQIEASQDRLRRFVADASHELRTPLTSVRGYAELFRRGAAGQPEDLALVMQRIEAEAERMGVLVDDLLLLARLDQGRPLERKPVDLSALVGDLVAEHRMLHADWPIELQAGHGVSVAGDELRLRQAIGNLLSNARSHTPAGTHIAVRVAAAEQASVEVSDTGPGIPPDLAGHVFERFFRADASRARASGGAGLGLSIVAAIAEAHGGRAELVETSERGTCFRIVLPLAVRGHADDQLSEPAPTAEQH